MSAIAMAAATIAMAVATAAVAVATVATTVAMVTMVIVTDGNFFKRLNLPVHLSFGTSLFLF